MTPRPNARLPKIPEMTIRRLSVYTRCLLQLEEDGVKTVSSQELAERFNLNSAQVRKDLAYFGEFGVRGIGYYVSGLKAELQKILGLHGEWPAALVGFGNLGSALFHYKGSARQGFRISAIFDDDPAKNNREVNGVPVLPARELGREVKARGIQIGIVAAPAERAQAAAGQPAAPGPQAILDFSPPRVRPPPDSPLQDQGPPRPAPAPPPTPARPPSGPPPPPTPVTGPGMGGSSPPPPSSPPGGRRASGAAAPGGSPTPSARSPAGAGSPASRSPSSPRRPR